MAEQKFKLGYDPETKLEFEYFNVNSPTGLTLSRRKFGSHNVYKEDPNVNYVNGYEGPGTYAILKPGLYPAPEELWGDEVVIYGNPNLTISSPQILAKPESEPKIVPIVFKNMVSSEDPDIQNLQNRYITNDTNKKAIDLEVSEGYGSKAWGKYVGLPMLGGAITATAGSIALPFIAPGTFVGNLIGTTAEGLALSNITNEGYKLATGSLNGYMEDAFNWLGGNKISNPYLREGANFIFNLADPAFYGGIGKKTFNYIESLTKQSNKATIENVLVKLEIGANLSPEELIIASRLMGGGLPSNFNINNPIYFKDGKMTKEGLSLFLKNREPYYNVEPDYINALDEIGTSGTILEKGLRIRGDRGARIDKKGRYDRTDDHLNLQEMLNLYYGYGLDINAYPREHYIHDASLTFEIPRTGPDQLPSVAAGSNTNDIMYSHGHNMWNDMSPEIRLKITSYTYGNGKKNPLNKMFKRNPDSVYSAESRAYALAKELLTKAYNDFLTDYRFRIKDADEWFEYVDDIPDEILMEYLKDMHHGYWYNNGYLNLTDEGLEAIREAMKLKFGGRLRKWKEN